jgi:hypothetical protein
MGNDARQKESSCLEGQVGVVRPVAAVPEHGGAG